MILTGCRREYHIVVLGAGESSRIQRTVGNLLMAECLGGVGKSCLTGIPSYTWFLELALCADYSRTAQFVQNVWIESYDPTIEDSYRKQIEVDVSHALLQNLNQKLTWDRGGNVF